MTQPPPPPPPGPPPIPQGQAPSNHLIWSILVTVLCCLPLGVAAIVKSSQVNALWAQGNYGQAQKAADDAKKFAIWGAIAGVIIMVIYVMARSM